MTEQHIYGADSIKILEGLEAVRKRPSMYIGNVDIEGLHHLVYEVVDNSIDEAMAGYCDTINVIIHTDNSVSVEDNGRGIPVGIHKTENVPALEVVMTKLHAGGKFDNESYKVSGGLHGVGVSVVNALSKLLEVEVYSGGNIYYQTYEKGKKTCELQVRGITDKRGTKIHFTPDTEILNNDNFSFEILCRRLRELAFLNKGIKITIEDERTDEKNEFCYKGGITEFVEYLNKHTAALHKPIFIEGDKNDTQVELAIQYNDTFTEKIFSFANNINTIEGGFHLIGFKAALTRTINQYAEENLPKNLKSKISGEDVREGLTAIISVRIKTPQFEGQTKTKLGNSDVKGLVESLVNEKLSLFFEENPAIAKKIIAKSAEAARARDAAKRARDLARNKGSLLDSSLPGKLAECQATEPADRELFLVEGDSAGGCFFGCTKIACSDGRDLSFKEIIAEQEGGNKDHFCYTITKDGNIGLERIINPRMTKKNVQVIKITLDNDEELICTPDHPFMLRDGTYKQAVSLNAGDSLMPFYHKILKEAVINHNHKVKQIEFLTEKMDVYDIEVPNTHNFALAAGIFVHNSAKQGRDRRFQAILPLKGKILNVEKARFDKILSSEEIRNMITVLGTGVGDEEYDIEKIRYKKVIIMSVAGDEPTLVMDKTGNTELVEIGRFIDECCEEKRRAGEYRVISFDSDTHTTGFKPLKAVIRHAHHEPIYKITTRYNRSFKVTSSHSVFVFENGKVSLKKGDKVRAGDILVAPLRLPRPEKSPVQIDLIKTFYEAGLTQNLYLKGEDVRNVAGLRLLAKVSRQDQWIEPRVRLESQGWQTLIEQRQAVGVSQKQVAASCGVRQPITISHWERNISQPTLPDFLHYLESIGGNENIAYDILPSRMEKLLNQDDTSKHAHWRVVSCYKRFENFTSDELLQIGDDVEIIPQAYHNKAFPRYLPITRELMWFLGWYAAEGTLSKHQVSLNLGRKDEPFFSELTGAVEKVFGETPRQYQDKRHLGVKFYFHSVVAARLIKAWGLNEHSNKKRVPDILFSLDEKLKMAFLNGYFLGDGTISGPRISFTTNSEKLKDGLLYLFGQLGLIATTSYFQPDKDLKVFLRGRKPMETIQTRHPFYTVTITGKDQLEQCRDIWHSHGNAHTIDEHLERPMRKKLDYTPISEDLIGLKVLSNEEIDPVGEYVYDFSVENDENFVCGRGGLYSHNTDADVDGSHIRTLLLTFFYRQMTDIVDKGYLYIAQPPLFRVGKGKSEMYLKDEKELNDYILKRICSQKNVKNSKDEKILSDHNLYIFIGDLSEYMNAISKLNRRGINPELIETLIKQDVGDKSFLQDEQKMTVLKDLLEKQGYAVSDLFWNEERNVFEIIVKPSDTDEKKIVPEEDTAKKEVRSLKIGRGLIHSPEYQMCLILGKKIFPFDYPPFSVFNTEKKDDVVLIENKRNLLNFMIEDGKKGIAIQRYKGLGEMNPGQLWETTMNPEKRILLKVKVEDAVSADQIFTLLMGDVVEPRREFIQNNALEVSTLDI